MPSDKNMHERRQARRLDTTIQAVAKTSQGARHPVQINDLSTGGCAVVATRHPLKTGLAYGLKIDGLETLGAVAAWSAGQDAGLAFDRSLHPAVAEHLVRLNPPAPDESVAAADETSARIGQGDIPAAARG